MKTIDLKPVREKKLSFGELSSLSKKDRSEIERLKIIPPGISYDLDDTELSGELDLGHIAARIKKVIYETDF